MIAWLLEPFTFAFMQRGLLAALIVGVLCAIVGCYVVLRSMAFLGDALAHAILPGVAIAYLIGGNLIVGALVAAIAVALGIGMVTRSSELKEDTAIGILFAWLAYRTGSLWNSIAVHFLFNSVSMIANLAQRMTQ